METCVQSTWALSISSRDPPACAALSLHLLLMLPLPLPLLLQFDQHFVEVVRWRPHAACGSSRRLRARERESVPASNGNGPGISVHDVGISLCRTNRTAAQQTDRQTERLTAKSESERPSDQLGDHPAPMQQQQQQQNPNLTKATARCVWHSLSCRRPETR